MKQKLSFLLLLLLCAISTRAQVKMGLNPSTVHPRAVLEMEDTARGFLPPRMTLAQRTAMTNVPLGLTVFVTDGPSAGYFFNASSLPGIANWKQLIMNENQFWVQNSTNFSNNLYYSPASGAARVGIGTTTPTYKLHVEGKDSAALLLHDSTAMAAGRELDLDFKQGTYYSARIRSRATNPGFAALGFYTQASTNPANLQERLTILDGGYVGVNNTNPTERLDIAGTIRIADGTQAVGRVLTSDGNGRGTWQSLPIHTEEWTRTGSNIVAANGPGNVGIAIGPLSISEKLHIDTGNMKIGRTTWSSTANDHFLKFGDGDYVSIGETGADDRMQLTGQQIAFRSSPFTPIKLRVVNADMRLYEGSGADSTIVLRGARSSGQSGEIYFVDPGTNERTLTIDGDYNNSNRSRIIVDELQITGGSDFAEMFDVAAAQDVQPKAGMLVSIDEAHPGDLIVSSAPYDNKVAGVISGAGGVKPGMMMGQKGTAADGAQPVAITGRVYVKADATTEAIRPGDLLTTSALPGHAMKAADVQRRAGAVIGKAMTPLAKGTTGEVLVLLGIQ